MLFNSLELFIIFPAGLSGLLCDTAPGEVSVLACIQLFLLYVLESQVCAFDVYVYSDYICIGITYRISEQSGGWKGKGTQEKYICSAFVYQ